MTDSIADAYVFMKSQSGHKELLLLIINNLFRIKLHTIENKVSLFLFLSCSGNYSEKYSLSHRFDFST